MTTTVKTAEIQAYEKDLVDRAVRYARETDRCEEFEEFMENVLPGVPVVDSDGLNCEGETPEVDADQVKADHEKVLVDRAIRLARQHPGVVSATNAAFALRTIFPGATLVDSAGKGL